MVLKKSKRFHSDGTKNSLKGSIVMALKKSKRFHSDGTKNSSKTFFTYL